MENMRKQIIQSKENRCICKAVSKKNALQYGFTDNRITTQLQSNLVENILAGNRKSSNYYPVQMYRSYNSLPALEKYSGEKEGKMVLRDSDGNSAHHISVYKADRFPLYWRIAHVTWDKYNDIALSKEERFHYYFEDCLNEDNTPKNVLGYSHTQSNNGFQDKFPDDVTLITHRSEEIAKNWLLAIDSSNPYIPDSLIPLHNGWGEQKKIKRTYEKKPGREDFDIREKQKIKKMIYNMVGPTVEEDSDRKVVCNYEYEDVENAKLAYLEMYKKESEDRKIINKYKADSIIINLQKL